MAEFADTTDFTRWNSALHNICVATNALAVVEDEEECEARSRVEQAWQEARTRLFAVPAPTVGEVIEKLHNWFGESLHDGSYKSSRHRIVIGDLRRIGLETAGIEDDEASGRTPGEVALMADAWRKALADYRQLENLWIEGPSPRWAGREAGELMDAMADAADVLLQLPAPNLGGVVLKLNLLWENDRDDTVEQGAFVQYLVWDLNTLACLIANRASDAT